MDLGQLIDELKRHPADAVVLNGFTHPHSYRGYYERLAFEPCQGTTVGEMLAEAEAAVGRTFRGYKGGDYRMSRYTECYLAEYGCCGEEINKSMLHAMIGEVCRESLISAASQVVESFRVSDSGVGGRLPEPLNH